MRITHTFTHRPRRSLRRVIRPTVQWLHRWLGLTLGLLLVLAGLSGSLLVFNHELDERLNPQLFHNRVPCAAPLDVAGAVASLQRQWPQAKVGSVYLPSHPGASYGLYFKAPGVGDAEAMLDSCSGAVLGSRSREEFGLDAPRLMPSLQRWHANLLQGKPGRAALGWLALAWVALLAAGLLLAWPTPAQGWKRALNVRWRQNAYRANFDLHRSAGLLAIVLMLVTAVTGFYNGLPELARALVGQVAPVSAEHRAIALPALAKGEAGISWNDAKAIAEQHLSDGAILLALNRLPDRGLYQVRLRRADDWQRTGTLRLLIDIRSGAVIETVNPLAGPAGDRFLAALFPLHSGQFGAATGRAVMVGAGLLPALFFITGLSTWIMRRRRKTA
ncbi:PepSY-associated TM helix domain-containing protein [Duganella sp. LjRoot269]|uniref:PepSY-associated TM helix domain-containing protein n=1 Tax=Duganella sp. LjRoot269 TaxID=3342305 RepID=UPI003ECF09CD